MATSARKVTEGKPLHRNLAAAKAAKQDEFYTQYIDIQKEVEAYLEFDPDTFRGKVVYCNCDDPFESNFFKYFAANFNKLGLKKLVSTSYDGSPIAGQGTLFPEYNEGNGKRQKPKALAVILDRVKDEDGDGAANVTDVELFLKRNKAARIALKADEKYPGGDFRSPECIALLKEADVVVTNPPFSLFKEYVAQLVEHSKKFLIIGNVQAITYLEIFPLIKDNKLWLGVESQEVVPFKARTTDRWSMVEATMRAVPVVVVQPGKKLVMALLGVLIEIGIDPFAKSSLDKSFGFTVGARGVGTGEVMAQAHLNHSRVKSVGAIAMTVIGKQATNGDA